ncbi:MAG: GDP-mannose 4,6-dehydratase [Candidatus Tenebribacter burtonii]|jgi:UDP-glucuronate 4-epimerase|nr:GDP-mannose 4,6-dehydratase [Candidatus Tenebribacter burtonii]
MKILITGAAGFIGSHLCEALVKKHDVVGLDNFCDYYDIKIKRNNLKELAHFDNFQIIKADIRSKDELEDIFSHHKFDLVIHLAAMAGVRPSIIDPVLYTEVNINGTVNMLEQCKKHGINKFIFASSSSVYGNNKKVPFTETDSVDFPISPYAATKKAGELICHTYHHLENISMVILRFFTVYGPRQRPDLAIHKFARKIIADEVIPVFGNGSTKRDYTYIDDIIDGILRSVDFVNENYCYEIFNLGEAKTISLSRMIKIIENALGKTAQKEILKLQSGDVDQTFADISKANRLLGYNPKTKFKTGVDKFIVWLMKN